MSKTPKEIWCKSGLYYEYVKDWSEGSWSPTNDGGVKYVRADRIEELEANHRKAYEALLKVTRINDELEAKLVKAVEALGRLVYLQSGGPCTGIQSEQWLSEARTTLAELTGGNDD